MPGRDFAALLQAEPTARVLGDGSGAAGGFDRFAWLGQLIAAGDAVLSEGRAVLWLCDGESDGLRLAFPERNPAPVASLDGLAAACLGGQRDLDVADVTVEPGFRASADAACGLRTRSLLCLPLTGHDGEPLGVLQLLRPCAGPAPEPDRRLMRALAAQCQLTMQQVQLIDRLRENVRLEEEVEVAREIQFSTLPETMPAIPGYEVHGCFFPARHAGGDLFDLVMLDGRLFILMGDATGHGFGPALSATQMQAMLRVAFRCGADLDAAYRHVNNQLEEDLPDDRFITAFIGFLDPERAELRYHSGGQAPILHWRAATGTCAVLPPTTFPLGALPLDRAPAAATLALSAGDLLALLSDGVFEYRDENGEQFGVERVEAVLQSAGDRPAERIADELLAAVRAHGGDSPQEDDITIVLVRRRPGGAA
ncbi:MAG: SpoIIE family protein phosphatase [Xanthomonadales bacterium]